MIDYTVVLNEVDNTAESIFLTDGKADGNSVGFKPFAHHVYGVFEVRAVNVHLVYVSNTGNVILVRLTPYGFGLRLNAALRAESCHRAVEYAKRSFNLYGKVNVSRGVDNVYSVAFPETGGGCGTNGYTSFLFLNHKVHSRRAVVNLAEFMRLSRVEKYTLGSGGFARVDVSHYTYVSGMI